ncbi:MAG: glycoside hydrolase family 15 protein [Actinobacteria bacterium]|nr:glycoside hydrolase family 15 protein [Actinomycetota bacterium]MBI3686745.1 glycoside hydrolase family 15 protein [Actinomycetota bacterium]
MRIEDYALIGDTQTAALVGRNGSIDWLCFPRFDSAACFAALLDIPEAGRWSLRPAGATVCTRRRYRGDTLVLETEWETPDGVVRVVDLMPPRDVTPDLVRVVEGVSGRVPMLSDVRLRFDNGRVLPWVRDEGSQHVIVAGPDMVRLVTPVPMRVEDHSSVAEFAVAAGDRIAFVLTWQPSWTTPRAGIDGLRAVDDTVEYWLSWIDQCSYRGEYAGLVRRSLITLKALTYAPTGGIVAAATTSLPEQLGGSRNWDYRYCWLRDAAFSLQALMHAGYVDEARAWRDWLLRAVAGDPADLQIMYSVRGHRRLPEWEVGWLSGYESAQPVRIGNAATGQFQLDVWGEVIDCLHLAREVGLSRDEYAWEVQVALLDFLEANWQRPDNGLWEVRGPRQHFVHSKVLAWVAVDRMIAAVEGYGRTGPLDKWKALRDQIHNDVCRNGYDPRRNTFTQYYGSAGLDAALLLLPRLGFLPPDDPRVVGTVDAVQRELVDDGFVVRYRPLAEGVDGLPGEEGAFLACSFWLADALSLIGRPAQARQLFTRLVGLTNDVGLLAEEHDLTTRRLTGNFPQAFSHVSLVNTAFALDQHHPLRSRRAARQAGGSSAR